jgi:hypothetical protein
MDLFAEMIRSNQRPTRGPTHTIRGYRHSAPPQESEPKPNKKN